MANNAPRIRIGTAGWSIPATSRAHYPADGHALQRYATLMNAVEIKSSFYRPHAAGTYARWASLVPRGFRFSVKLPRTITQFARLVDTEDLLDGFFEQVAGLGAKLGRCVVQLPPSLVFDAVVADRFFAALRERADRTGLACEPRHSSWGGADADALLRKHGAARIAADPPRFQVDALPGGSRPAYWRLHGSPRIYRDDYDAQALQRLRTRLRRGDWVIFDNTAEGHATANALSLQKLLQAR